MSSILQPPRAFQLSIVFVFPEDPRSDAELGTLMTKAVSTSLELTAYAKGASVVRVAVPSPATLPLPGDYPKPQ